MRTRTVIYSARHVQVSESPILWHKGRLTVKTEHSMKAELAVPAFLACCKALCAQSRLKGWTCFSHTSLAHSGKGRHERRNQEFEGLSLITMTGLEGSAFMSAQYGVAQLRKCWHDTHGCHTHWRKLKRQHRSQSIFTQACTC